MTKAATNAILFGALLFVLGLSPSLISALVAGVLNFRDHLSGTAGLTDNVENDFRANGDIGLLVGGAVLMIAGLVAHLAG